VRFGGKNLGADNSSLSKVLNSEFLDLKPSLRGALPDLSLRFPLYPSLLLGDLPPAL
jgi:hypothetical protein